MTEKMTLDVRVDKPGVRGVGDTFDDRVMSSTTSAGTVVRSVRIGKHYHATLGGMSLVVHDPHGACYVLLDKDDPLPRDLEAK